LSGADKERTAVTLFLLSAGVPGKSALAAATHSADLKGEISADFNGDGFDDLAIGVPYEDVSVGGRDIEDAGAVQVIYGSSTGLNGDAPIDDEVWHQNRFSGFVTTPEPDDFFGYALATGDFNSDGFDDLAIGVPGEDVPVAGREIADAGEVDLLRGSPTGLNATVVALRQGGRFRMPGIPQKGDHFGFSLATGDLGMGPPDDLAIGVPDDDVGVHRVKDAGAVNVVYGFGVPTESATDWFFEYAPGPRYWTQDTLGIQSRAEAGDRFGFSLVVADLKTKVVPLPPNPQIVGKPGDLVVGVPYEDVGPIKDAGAVNVIYSAGLGLSKYCCWLRAAGSQFLHQGFRWIAGVLEPNDHFGWALAAADFRARAEGGRGRGRAG
jgi:hypothetical protein